MSWVVFMVGLLSPPPYCEARARSAARPDDSLQVIVLNHHNSRAGG
jgi:hypothetical protein